MTGTVAIRNAVPADIPRIVALLNVAFAMERAFVDRDRTSVEEITAYLGAGTFLVIDADRDALAACVYLEQRGSRVYLGMLAVAPSYQGRGLARRLMAAAEVHAAGLGCRAIDIRIVDRRVELPPLYRALGFVDNGTAPFDDPLLTKPCHFILMSKEVTS